MALTPSTIHDIASEILGCVCAALDQVAEDNPGLSGCPTCQVCVVPGVPAWDACLNDCSGEAGGQLTVSLARLYASTHHTFPAEDRTVRDARECMVPSMAAEFVIGVTRCAPGPTEQGCPPSCDDLTASARQLHADAATVFQALLCCVPRTSTAHRGRRFVMGPQRVIGPEGGCVGIEQRVTVELPGCAPCEFVGGV